LIEGVEIAASPEGALRSFSSDEAVAVAVPDLTRSLDLPGALRAVYQRLSRPGPVVVGLGLHRRMTVDELGPIAQWTPLQHDPDDVVATAAVNGIRGTVSRAIAEAPWSIGVGVAELHQYAGLSGGHKGVAVGCGGRETIAALHHRDGVTAEGVAVGRLEGNPFRETVDRLGEAARCRLALVFVPAAGVWIAGEPTAVLRAALERMQPWWTVSAAFDGAIVHVDGGKAVSLYQASRAATYLSESPRPPLHPGATIVVAAACTEGMGAESGFRAAMEGTAPPWTALLSGDPPAGPGAQRAVMIARLAQRYRLRVMGCKRPDALRAFGIDATDAPPPTGPTWLQVPQPFQQLPQLA